MAGNNGIIGAYYTTWRAAVLPPERIPNSFTHVFYAFANVNPQNFTVSTVDEDATRTFTLSLRSRNAPPKLLLSIGGYGKVISDTFSLMASSAESRATFIASAIEAALRLGFDGLDLDWEFPFSPQEMELFSSLLLELRQAAPPPFLLTAAVYYKTVVYGGPPDPIYPAAAIRENLDFVCVMSYDIQGALHDFSSVTSQHALLYSREEPTYCASAGLASWINAGVPANKVVMGIPLYGKTWKLRNPNNHGIGSLAVGRGIGDENTLTYDQIVDFNGRADGTVYDQATVAEYSYAGTDWVGYDGPQSVKEKIRFAKGKRLGGYFFWELGMDNGFALPQIAYNTWMN